MYEKEIVIKLAEGLHARPASNFVKKAMKYKETAIQVLKDDKSANAKSMMAVLSLGAGVGSRVKIKAEGPNETEAVEELSAFLVELP